ncbi:hypothetical protein GCM10023334_110340 [Nonomuraea thailandensis]
MRVVFVKRLEPTRLNLDERESIPAERARTGVTLHNTRNGPERSGVPPDRGPLHRPAGGDAAVPRAARCAGEKGGPPERWARRRGSAIGDGSQSGVLMSVWISVVLSARL